MDTACLKSIWKSFGHNVDTFSKEDLWSQALTCREKFHLTDSPDPNQMTESSAIQTIREFGYFLVTDGLSGNILLKRGKNSTVGEGEEKEEEETGNIRKYDEVKIWRGWWRKSGK